MIKVIMLAEFEPLAFALNVPHPFPRRETDLEALFDKVRHEISGFCDNAEPFLRHRAQRITPAGGRQERGLMESGLIWRGPCPALITNRRALGDGCASEKGNENDGIVEVERGMIQEDRKRYKSAMA